MRLPHSSAQEHRPGELCQSDFTHCRELDVTINRQAFPHLIYHFVLTYSNWETGTICYSETFESLSEGLQNALWELGGVPIEHRTDRLSAAVNNLVDTREFTRAYEGLLRHYRINGQKTQPGHANENGDVEQRHYRFKNALDQALMLRGSRDFGSVAAYQVFLQKLFEHLNAGRHDRFLEEVSRLQPLPEHRLDTVRRERVRVSPGSLVTVHRNTYSVHSRLIGEMVEARVLPDTVEVWYGDRKVEELPRLRGRSKHRIDYRHIIDWLVRKRARLNTIAIARICFQRAGSGSRTMRCAKNTGRSGVQKNTCRSWPWLPNVASQWWKTSFGYCLADAIP
jgi:hypothetical protein